MFNISFTKAYPFLSSLFWVIMKIPWCGMLLWPNFKLCAIGLVGSMQVARKEMSQDWKVEKVIKHWENYYLDNSKADQALTNIEALRETVRMLVIVGFYLYYVFFQQCYSYGIKQPGLETLNFPCHQFSNFMI